MILKKNINAFKEHIARILYKNNPLNNYFLKNNNSNPSGVLVLIGQDNKNEPCLILNKRSQKVKQPGDLCCPGGGLMPVFDSFSARFMHLPGFPMSKWKYWHDCINLYPDETRQLSLFLANSLREGFEEMRLNPFGISFLGILDPQPLIMFRRVIYPMAGWVESQKRFFPNWEVEKIVNIPFKSLLNPNNYGCYSLEFAHDLQKRYNHQPKDFPCFIHYEKGKKEILWGATYRIIAGFLELTMDFKPPAIETLPVIQRLIENNYVTRKQR
ncbi:Uncharacterized protein dnl_38810 [Desulfonema limicola]|uniref:Nudix hydrolase domain-containing protein n=1 Tax=Desulfonema limicola TaxID=45656 RepID=A0A975B9V5_9BACT|nr:CoA pyrophosphatase [Desulfonema limicola]QTA81543.1 Uncharacterized protein dnl_38810 [Desulfonema limicola]